LPAQPVSSWSKLSLFRYTDETLRNFPWLSSHNVHYPSSTSSCICRVGFGSRFWFITNPGIVMHARILITIS
jgi:hypothetical protein